MSILQSGLKPVYILIGLAIGLAVVGVVAGLLFVRYINQIEAVITYITGRKVFDEKIYYFKEIPTHVEMFTIVWIALGAIAIAVLASVLPARRAAQLNLEKQLASYRTQQAILINVLQDYEGTFIVVSHDRYFLTQIANKIWWIEDHHVKEYPGPYEEYEYSQQVKKQELKDKEKEK